MNENRRTPHGVRGLKLGMLAADTLVHGRTPHGVRGLKSREVKEKGLLALVAPHTGCVD